MPNRKNIYKMSIDDIAWEIYARESNLPQVILNDKKACELLRGSIGFSAIRLGLAWKQLKNNVVELVLEWIRMVQGK